MKRRVLLSLITLVGGALLAGCGGGGSGSGNPDDFDPQIISAYQRLETAIENEDDFNLSLSVSPNYFNSGTNRSGYLDAFDEIFSDYNNIQMNISISDITYDSDSLPFYAYVRINYTITGVNQQTGQTETIFQTSSNAQETLHFEDSRWKLYGNQSSTPLSAQGGAKL